MLLSAAVGCSEKEASDFLNRLFDDTEYTITGDELTGDLLMAVNVIDVGQGESILVQCGNANVLIDCGENGMGEVVLDYLDYAGVTHIDWLIATHPHSDHIGGMDVVINSDITIDNVMMPLTSDSVTSDTNTYQDVLDAVEQKGLEITAAERGASYELDGVTMLVLSPRSDAAYSDLNDYSVVLKFTCANVSFITGGDATTAVEQELLALDFDLSAEIYNVAHHGSSLSNSAEFISAISPIYSSISVGKDNDYGHPKQEVLDRLNAVGSVVNRTDLDGNIVYETDGENIRVVTFEL